MKLKMGLTFLGILYCFGAFADINTVNLKCSISSYRHEGELHLSVKKVITKTDITAEGMRQEIDTITTILPYWPNSHRYGMSQLQEVLREGEEGCEIDPQALLCSLEMSENNVMSLILKKAQSDEKVLTISATAGSITVEQMAQDFRELGICH